MDEGVTGCGEGEERRIRGGWGRFGKGRGDLRIDDVDDAVGD